MDHRISKLFESITEDLAQLRKLIQQNSPNDLANPVVAPEVLQRGQVDHSGDAKTSELEEVRRPEVPDDKISAMVIGRYSGTAVTYDLHVFEGDPTDPRQLLAFADKVTDACKRLAEDPEVDVYRENYFPK